MLAGNHQERSQTLHGMRCRTNIVPGILFYTRATYFQISNRTDRASRSLLLVPFPLVVVVTSSAATSTRAIATQIGGGRAHRIGAPAGRNDMFGKGIGPDHVGFFVQDDPHGFGGDQSRAFRFEILACDEFVHVISVQGQSGFVPSSSAIGAGIGDQERAVSCLENPKGRMLHAHRCDETAHQDRFDAGNLQNIHQRRIAGAGPTRFGNDDFPALRRRKFFPGEFRRGRIAWDFSQISWTAHSFELRQPGRMLVPIVGSDPDDFGLSLTTYINRLFKVPGKFRKRIANSGTIGPVLRLDINDQQCGRFGSERRRTTTGGRRWQ